MDNHHAAVGEERGSRRRLSAVGLLAAGIAHDFNNLASNIVQYADLALTDEPPQSTSGEALTKIRTLALRASDIVRQLMAYIGQEPSQIEPVDVSALVGEMLDLLRISVPPRAKLTTDLAKDLPPVLAVPAELREVVMNLVLNASEALGGKRGEIRISTACIDAPMASANGAGRVGPPLLQLVVSDDGPGIPAQARSHMFHPFFTTKEAGAGLGLAIVNGIVRRRGGSIQLTSAPGRGTTFTILLPTAHRDPKKVPPRPDVDVAAPTRAAKTILLLDHDEALRAPAALLLRRRGFHVVEAANVASALDRLRMHRRAFHAIVLDLTLAGSPQHILEEVGRLCPEASIFLLGPYEKDAAKAGSSVRVKGFVPKPYQPSDLLRIVERELQAEKPLALGAATTPHLRSKTTRTFRANAHGEIGSGK